MMLGAGLPKECWGHAMMHAAHVDKYLGTSANSTDSPHSLWYGTQKDPDFKIFASKVWFVDNEDRGKLDPPGHRGIFLGYCDHTDGIYVWDQGSPGQPVRMSRNYLGKSFHEQCAVQTEPIGISADSFELLNDEIDQLQSSSYMNPKNHSLPHVEPDNVPTERLQHYSDMATFVRDRRAKYAQNYDLTPHEAEQRVHEEWKLRERRRFESAAHARTLEQRLAQVQDAHEKLKATPVKSNGSAGNTVPPAPNLKRVLLTDEPSTKKRRTGHVSQKTPAEDGNVLLQSEVDEAASQAPTRPLKSKTNKRDKQSKSGSQASGGEDKTAPRRSKGVKPSQKDDRYVGSETPAEKQKGVRESKEAPDKYTPCKVCNKWECDNVSNQMLICDGCDGY